MAAELRQKWHWFVYVIIGMRALWLAGGLNDLHVQPERFAEKTGISWSPDMVWPMTAGYILSSAVPLALYMIRRVPRWVPVLAELAVSGTMYLVFSVNSGSGFDFFNVPVLTLGFISTGWHAAWALAAGVGVFPVLAGWIWGFPLAGVSDEIFNLLVLFIIGFCFQKIVSSYQKINGMYAIIRQQNQMLEQYSKQIEKLTLAEERNRLSRDLHDTVGHTFTTTIMGMDAVYYLIDLNPEEAKKSLRELLHVTRSGLDEVRRHIHQIAPEKDGLPLSASLGQIGSEFALHTGTVVDFAAEGAEFPVPEQIRWTLIRCLQESLTNAKRHGEATRVTVRLKFEPNALILNITDNGKGNDHLVKGFGLQGMTERLANLNGSLEIQSDVQRGTTVACQVPVMRRPMESLKQEGA